jgi:hypothetical protein
MKVHYRWHNCGTTTRTSIGARFTSYWEEVTCKRCLRAKPSEAVSE